MIIADRYEVIEELGRGGMGTVFRALDNRLEREVAVKLLPGELSIDESFTKRFAREARVVARMAHPNIVSIYDVGEHEHQPFIVMRYLKGGTLRDRISNRSMPPEQLMIALNQLARALDTIHSKGIVHRDIKPSNILFDEWGTAFLSDFGIAKVDNARTNLTGNRMVGTPAYMSPEQCRGVDVDGRSDLYSLAVVAYEVLAGQPPFAGDTMAVMYKHVHEAPPPITQVNPLITPAMEAVLEKALSKNPADRHERLVDFVAALSAPSRGNIDKTMPMAQLPDFTLESTMISPTHPARSESTKPAASPAAPTAVTQTDHDQTVVQPVAPTRSGGRGWIIAVVLFLLLGGGGFAAYTFLPVQEWLAGAPTATATPDEPDEPTVTATPAVARTGEMVLSGDFSGAVWQVDDDLQRIPADGVLPITDPFTPIELQAGRDPLTIALPNQTLLYLDADAEIAILAVEDNYTDVSLDRGRLVAIPTSRDVTVLVADEEGNRALTSGGRLGLSIDGENDALEVDCLGGRCTLVSEDGGRIELVEGRRGSFDDSGEPIDAAAARFERFTAIAALIPTPTMTVEPTDPATETPTPTETPVPTDTPTPTLTHTPTPEAEETETPTPTATSTEVRQSTGPAGTGGGLPLTFETFGLWTRGDEDNGTLSQSTARSRSGASARLDYEFGTGENDYVVFLQFNDIAGRPDTIAAWVYGDGSGHFLNVWIQDSAGQTWQVPLGRVTHNGWQQMSGEIDTDQEWPWTHISGPNNEQVDYPIRFRGFVYDDLNNASSGSGTIYIDDVTIGGTASSSSGSSSSGSSGGSSSGTSPTATSAPVFSGDVGRIIYTSNSVLMTTDPSWSSPEEIGTVATNSCSGTATTVSGDAFSLYFSPKCGIGEGSSLCKSPNGGQEILFNGTFSSGFTINIRPVGSEDTGTFVWQGNDIDLNEGIRWNPNSSSFMWVVGDTVFLGFSGGGYSEIIPIAYNPNFSPDGTSILYRKPVGPGVNDVFVAAADGTGQRNVTNVGTVDKICAAWTR